MSSSTMRAFLAVGLLSRVPNSGQGMRRKGDPPSLVAHSAWRVPRQSFRRGTFT